MFPPGLSDGTLVSRGERRLRRRPSQGGGSDPSCGPWRAGRTHAEHVRLPGRRRWGDPAETRSASSWRTGSCDATSGDDFIGVQTYSRSRIGPHGMLGPEEGVDVATTSAMSTRPQALGETIRRAWDVTGGRVADPRDRERHRHRRRRSTHPVHPTRAGERARLRRRGHRCAEATRTGSLLDNFEWTFGYGPHFGLVEVDRSSPFQRRPKPSAHWLASVVRDGVLHQ